MRITASAASASTSGQLHHNDPSVEISQQIKAIRSATEAVLALALTDNSATATTCQAGGGCQPPGSYGS